MWIHRTDLSQGSEVDMRWKQWHLFHCLFDEKKIPDIFWEGISLIPQKYFDLSSWHSFYWARVHCSHHSLPGWELFQTKSEGWAGRTGWGTRGRHSEQCVERGWEQQELGNVTCIFKVSWYLSWYWFQSREPISIRQLLWRGPGHLWRHVLSGKGWALESDLSSDSDFISYGFVNFNNVLTLFWYLSYLTQGVRLIDLWLKMTDWA